MKIDNSARPYTLQSPDQQAVQAHVTATAVSSWRDLDLNQGHQLHEFFAVDGIYDFAGEVVVGQETIRARFSSRRDAGERTTLHMLSNFSCTPRQHDSVELAYYVCVFGADGSAVQPVKLPTLLGTVDDTFHRQPDGRWLIRSRAFRPLFNDPTDRVGRRATHHAGSLTDQDFRTRQDGAEQ